MQAGERRAVPHKTRTVDLCPIPTVGVASTPCGRRNQLGLSRRALVAAH